ncbi:MAG TPA: MlaD family protein, partial [Candidatus Ozemobacteraceae bacterium]|nr:MlaD family protein [Candidatus Ozemobacteraceae bacterium]
MEIPSANIVPRPKSTLPAALFLGIILVFAAYALYGLLPQSRKITISFSDAHQIKPGDMVRYKGIPVGEVTAVEPDLAMNGVLISAEISPRANGIFKAGARFWIERPQITAYGIKGLETLVSPEFIGALPGSGPERLSFSGLEIPPGFDTAEAAVEIILEGSRRGGISPGMPVSYRNVPIGAVANVGIS